jgi:hypothetical protein
MAKTILVVGDYRRSQTLHVVSLEAEENGVRLLFRPGEDGLSGPKRLTDVVKYDYNSG